MSLDISKLGPTGYGLMGLTWRPQPPPQDQAFAAMRAALDSGLTLWNGGELYGTPTRNSCHLLREYFTKYPEDASKVTLSIKGGTEKGGMKPIGTRENVRRSVEDCLAVLAGTKKIDVFECARVDPNVPIEETMGYLKELVQEGKIGGIALSEVRADTIRRAAKIHPIVTVEVEMSLWATDILHNGIASTCAELGIPVTAYSPLARGALVKRLKWEDIPEGDFKKTAPKYQPDVLDANNKLTDEVVKLAETKGVTPAQIAVSWVRELSGKKGLPVIIPIPGATTAERVRENCKHVELTEGDMEAIGVVLDKIQIVGERYGGHGAAVING